MVYFIQQGNNGPVKIGFSNNPGKRLLQLQTGSPEKLNLLAVIDGDLKDEKNLHQQFHEYRTNGEWFKPVTDIFIYIHSIDRCALKTAKCPVCEMQYLPNIEEDVKAHNERHALVLKGALPTSVQELMKEEGWVQARNGNDRGKLAIAYAWWARDRAAGLPDSAFDEYLIKKIEYIDAILSGNEIMANEISDVINKKWFNEH